MTDTEFEDVLSNLGHNWPPHLKRWLTVCVTNEEFAVLVRYLRRMQEPPLDYVALKQRDFLCPHGVYD